MATVGARMIKGFKAHCPYCGAGPDDESTVKLDLNDFNIITCSHCDEEFNVRAAVKRAAEHLARWQAIARWIDSAGELTADPETESE